MIKQFNRILPAVFSSLSRFFAGLRLQSVISVAFVGFFLLTSSVDSANLPNSTKTMLNDMIARGAEGRPVTTGQWQAENEELQGQPAKQAKRIAKESADAVGEMGEMYPDTAKSTLPGVENKSLERDD